MSKPLLTYAVPTTVFYSEVAGTGVYWLTDRARRRALFYRHHDEHGCIWLRGDVDFCEEALRLHDAMDQRDWPLVLAGGAGSL